MAYSVFMKPAPESSAFINRELSWLAFNSRVLEEVVNRRNPLIERLKFHTIFTSNLDEYFMKRVGGLKRRNEAVHEVLKNTDPEVDKTLNLIRQAVLPLLAKQADYLNQTLLPELADGGIRILSVKDLNESQTSWTTDFFKRNFFSVLTPLVVDEGHPFPFISNLSVSLGVLLADPKDESEIVFARIKVPNVFPAWIQLPNMGEPSRLNFVSAHQLIENNLDLLFPGMKILNSCSFRVLRNAIVDRDVDEEEESDDLLEIVAEELKERRFAEAIRLEISSGADPKIAELLKAELNLTENEVYELPMDLEFYQLGPICEIRKPSWEFPGWTPISRFDLDKPDRSIFDVIREKDVLV
ncbi:MAG: polyphosphate kinase 1, partial [Deltaproteobacteria bacterium]